MAQRFVIKFMKEMFEIFAQLVCASVCAQCFVEFNVWNPFDTAKLKHCLQLMLSTYFILSLSHSLVLA